MGKIQIDGSLEQYWQEQIKSKQESGLCRAAYCKKHDLSYHTFAYWEQKKVQRKKSQLLPVKLISTQDCNSGAKSQVLCSILLKRGAELKVFDPTILPILLPLLN